MPKMYEGIKEGLMRTGLNSKEAATKAARIYVGSGKSKKERSERAKKLKHK